MTSFQTIPMPKRDEPKQRETWNFIIFPRASLSLHLSLTFARCAREEHFPSFYRGSNPWSPSWCAKIRGDQYTGRRAEMGIIINTAPVFHAQWSLLRQNEEQKIYVVISSNHYLWPFDKITSWFIKSSSPLMIIKKVMSELIDCCMDLR